MESDMQVKNFPICMSHLSHPPKERLGRCQVMNIKYKEAIRNEGTIGGYSG